MRVEVEGDSWVAVTKVRRDHVEWHPGHQREGGLCMAQPLRGYVPDAELFAVALESPGDRIWTRRRSIRADDAMTQEALDALDHLCGGPPLSMGSGSDTMNIPWSKKGEAVAALEAVGFQVVEDQEAIDRLLVRDPTVS